MNEKSLGQNKMGTAPMFPLIVSMALPAMFSMLVQALYNIVDSYFVAQYSTEALAAVSLAFPIQNLIIAFSVGTSVGVSSLVSRKLGEGDRKSANTAADHGLILNMVTWLLFVVFGLVGCGAFYRLFESNTAIIEMGTSYLSIVSIFSFGIFIEICFEKILQATGNMIWPMLIQLIGAVINIILDPIMIFGGFGFPAMGVTGAAVATVVGQIVAAIIAVVVMFTGKHEVQISVKGFRFNWHTIKDIYAVGFPAIVMNAIGTVMTMAMNGILATFSAAAYTVFGIYFKVQSFVFMPIFGLSSGLMPIMGYNYGAQNKKRLLSCLRIGMTIAVVINILGTLAFMIFPRELLSIFNANQEIYDIGIPALRIISSAFVFAAVGITCSTIFQAMGKGTYSLINSVMRQLALLVPLAFLLSKISLFALWFAFPIAEVGSVIVTLILFARLYRKQIKNLGQVQ
ncbi:MAG: MATE family efflux transporter [Oscillospiraceae bacterium]